MIEVELVELKPFDEIAATLRFEARNLSIDEFPDEDREVCVKKNNHLHEEEHPQRKKIPTRHDSPTPTHTKSTPQ